MRKLQTNSPWPTKLKILTIWPFIDSLWACYLQVKHVLDHFVLQNCALFNIHCLNECSTYWTLSTPCSFLVPVFFPVIEDLLFTWINLSNTLTPTSNPLGSLSDDFCWILNSRNTNLWVWHYILCFQLVLCIREGKKPDGCPFLPPWLALFSPSELIRGCLAWEVSLTPPFLSHPTRLELTSLCSQSSLNFAIMALIFVCCNHWFNSQILQLYWELLTAEWCLIHWCVPSSWHGAGSWTHPINILE